MPKRKQDRDGLYKKPDSPFWWCSFSDSQGKRIRRSTGQTNREQAKLTLAEWKSREGKKRTPIIVRSFEELMIAYMDAGRTVKDREKSANSLKRDEGCISALFDMFGAWMMQPEGAELSQIPGNVIDGGAVYAYIEARRGNGATDSTIRRELAVLGAAITYANARWEWNIVDPTRHRKPPQNEGRARWITRDEGDRLIQAAKQEPRAPHLADWIQAALYTGCRKEELLGLEWSRVDLTQNSIYLEAVHNKSRKRQSVPLNEQAREAILNRARFRAKHCPDSPWVFCNKAGQRIKDIKKGFASACRRVGIEDFHPHDCRHTLASWLVMEGVPLATVKAVLRHSSITVTEKYAHLAPESARDALGILNGLSHDSSRLRHDDKARMQ